MKVHIFEPRRKIWRHDWSSQLCTQLKHLWNYECCWLMCVWSEIKQLRMTAPNGVMSQWMREGQIAEKRGRRREKWIIAAINSVMSQWDKCQWLKARLKTLKPITVNKSRAISQSDVVWSVPQILPITKHSLGRRNTSHMSRTGQFWSVTGWGLAINHLGRDLDNWKFAIGYHV